MENDLDRRLDNKGETGKGKFWKGVLVGSLVTVFAGLIIVGMSAGLFLFGIGVMRQEPAQEQASGGPDVKKADEGLDYSRIVAKMSMLQQLVDQQFLYDEDYDRVEDYIYVGMLAGLEDPYTTYYTKEDYGQFKESSEGSYSGIGAMLSQNRVTGLITVVKVFNNTPAHDAGLRPGDILSEVSGQAVTGSDLDMIVSKYIKGEAGSQVTITVYRQEEDKYVDLTMERRKIEVQTVEHEMLDGQIGYIEVSQFEKTTPEQFYQAVDDLQAQGMKKLVLDLRNNPGGLLDAAVSMADYLLPDDETDFARKAGSKTLIVYTADKNGKGMDYTASDGHELDLPLVVLVNGESASASEVLTGALKDYGRAKVVGTTSFGKGIVQNLIPLPDGTAVKITTAHYYTPSGFDLHGKGIEPDVTVEQPEEEKTQLDLKPADDTQVRKAMEVLNQFSE